MNFMNTSLGDRTDQPSKKIKTGQDWYDNTPTMNIDSGMVSYRPALDFCNKTLQKLNPSQKIKLSTLGEQGVVSWLAKQAKKQGLIPDQFMEEDIYEVQDFLPEVFHDPAITSWALVLTDGEPLLTLPTKGPFKVIMNQGLPSPTKGYANSDWVDVDILDNLSDAEEIFKGMVLKNPNYYVGITGADHKFVKFQDPHKQDVAEGWKDIVAGSAMALGALGASAQSMPNINAQQVELTNKYYKVLVQRAVEDGRTLDARTKNFLMAKAQDAAAQKIQKSTAQSPTTQAKPQFPSQGSEQRRAKDFDQFESQDYLDERRL
jgi:hypothetical protein